MSTDLESSAKDISLFGLKLISRLEGCRLKVYLDTRGKPTIGVGHLLTKEFPAGLTWTMEQALEQLKADTRQVMLAINGSLYKPLTQPQFDALASLVFNIGTGAFGASSLRTEVNAGNYRRAGEQFLVWSKQPELRSRREAEKAIWDYGTV